MQRATDLLQLAVDVARAFKNHDLVAYSEVLRYRAMAAERQQDLKTAKTMLWEATQIKRDTLGNSPITANSFLAYARVLKKLKLKTEAKEYERTARVMLDGLSAIRSMAYTVDVKALR